MRIDDLILDPALKSQIRNALENKVSLNRFIVLLREAGNIIDLEELTAIWLKVQRIKFLEESNELYQKEKESIKEFKSIQKSLEEWSKSLNPSDIKVYEENFDFMELYNKQLDKHDAMIIYLTKYIQHLETEYEHEYSRYEDIIKSREDDLESEPKLNEQINSEKNLFELAYTRLSVVINRENQKQLKQLDQDYKAKIARESDPLIKHKLNDEYIHKHHALTLGSLEAINKLKQSQVQDEIRYDMYRHNTLEGEYASDIRLREINARYNPAALVTKESIKLNANQTDQFNDTNLAKFRDTSKTIFEEQRVKLANKLNLSVSPEINSKAQTKEILELLAVSQAINGFPPIPKPMPSATNDSRKASSYKNDVNKFILETEINKNTAQHELLSNIISEHKPITRPMPGMTAAEEARAKDIKHNHDKSHSQTNEILHSYKGYVTEVQHKYVDDPIGNVDYIGVIGAVKEKTTSFSPGGEGYSSLAASLDGAQAANSELGSLFESSHLRQTQELIPSLPKAPTATDTLDAGKSLVNSIGKAVSNTLKMRPDDG